MIEKKHSKEEYTQNLDDIKEIITEGLSDDETTFKYIHQKLNNQYFERSPAPLATR